MTFLEKSAVVGIAILVAGVITISFALPIAFCLIKIVGEFISWL